MAPGYSAVRLGYWKVPIPANQGGDWASWMSISSLVIALASAKTRSAPRVPLIVGSLHHHDLFREPVRGAPLILIMRNLGQPESIPLRTAFIEGGEKS